MEQRCFFYGIMYKVEMKSSLSYVHVKYIPAYSIYTRPKPTQPRFRPLLSPLVPLQSASHLKFGRPSVTAACVNIAEAMHIECQGGDRKKLTFKNQNLPTNPANFPCQIRHKPVFPVTLTKSYSSTLKSYNSCVARKESARHDSSSPDRAIIPHLHQLPDGNRTTALPRTLSLKNQLSNLP